MNNKGEWGVATNIEGFSFAVATENQEPIVYLTKNKDGKCIHEVASQEWLDHYMKTRMAPLEENSMEEEIIKKIDMLSLRMIEDIKTIVK